MSPDSLAKVRLELIEGEAVEEVARSSPRADAQDDAVELYDLDGRDPRV
jgi:hypothetical protein